MAVADIAQHPKQVASSQGWVPSSAVAEARAGAAATPLAANAMPDFAAVQDQVIIVTTAPPASLHGGTRRTFRGRLGDTTIVSGMQSKKAISCLRRLTSNRKVKTRR